MPNTLTYYCFVLVQPENEIIDYNTRFSGITAKDLGGQASKTLQQVQQDMDTFISADSILIGKIDK